MAGYIKEESTYIYEHSTQILRTLLNRSPWSSRLGILDRIVAEDVMRGIYACKIK